MRLGPKIIIVSSLLVAAGLSWLSASLAAEWIETRSAQSVRTALIEEGHAWADVHTDGLQVHIGGTAPNEAQRFAALSVAGQIVEASRVIDGTVVPPAQPIAPPRFSIEVLRNEDGISLIGLVPASLDRDALIAEIKDTTDVTRVTDFLESADHPVPSGWVQSLNFGLEALGELERSKISVTAGRVTVQAISGSEAEKRQIESRLDRRTPDGMRLALDISAPRPVITPFTLRFLIDDRGPRFDACSADTDAAADSIRAAARAAGMQSQAACTVGLGVPTPEWANAVEQGIAALAELGQGTLTYSDADVSLVAAASTPQATYDQVIGALESNLPDVFSLSAKRLEPETDGEEEVVAPEFIATRSPEGLVQLRGRLPNEVVHATVESFARARFGVDDVYMAARVTPAGLPDDWPVRVLAGLTALSELESGAVTVEESTIALRGVTGDQNASGEISRQLTEKLGEGAQFQLDVRYDETLDPLADLPTPQECVGRIALILTERKITFEPGSTTVEGESAGVVDDIAEILRNCRKVDMDLLIAGHTDSQGREQMNLELSEARSLAVLQALEARRVSTARITSKGYGETVPIADNDTEDGREANRRIEFRLIEPDPPEEAETPDAASGAEPLQDGEDSDGSLAAAETAEDATEQSDQADQTAEGSSDETEETNE